MFLSEFLLPRCQSFDRIHRNYSTFAMRDISPKNLIIYFMKSFEHFSHEFLVRHDESSLYSVTFINCSNGILPFSFSWIMHINGKSSFWDFTIAKSAILNEGIE